MTFKRLPELLAFLALLPGPASAGDFRVGASLGFGGSGLSRDMTVNSETVSIQRGEAPGMFSLFVDYLIRDNFSLAAEHSRGFRLSPFSSGITFTGVSGRWYFQGPAPSVPKSGDGSVLLVKAFVPFLGVGTGVASGTVVREEDQVPETTGSGVYIGYRMGADYALAPGWGLRPELAYSMTLSSTPSKLTEFSLRCGLYFFL